MANSLAAVVGGARQIECTVNGIGERAGNCSLEEVVMALKVRADYFGLDTGIETTGLYPASRLVSSVTGMHTPRNKAIVGQNAFAHEAGIHQHGMLKHAETYEIMRPESVGMHRSNLVLGKHSGRHAFRDRTRQLGFELSEDQLNRAFIEFKKLADRKKELFDADIEALIVHKDTAAMGPWRLRELRINTGGSTLAVAAVRLEHDSGEQRDEAAVGDGPIDATFKALERATEMSVELIHFDVRSVTTGEDAQGEGHGYGALGRLLVPRPRGQHRHRGGRRRGPAGGAEPGAAGQGAPGFRKGREKRPAQAPWAVKSRRAAVFGCP